MLLQSHLRSALKQLNSQDRLYRTGTSSDCCLIVGDIVTDPTDDVWNLTLQLKDIVDMVCAQKISVAQVAYLDILIQEYLESRKALFPECHLRPKHHFLRHYPALILKFGPLIRLWTMRFESKHSYFKRYTLPRAVGRSNGPVRESKTTPPYHES